MTGPLSTVLPGLPPQSVPLAENAVQRLETVSLQQLKERSYES